MGCPGLDTAKGDAMIEGGQNFPVASPCPLSYRLASKDRHRLSCQAGIIPFHQDPQPAVFKEGKKGGGKISIGEKIEKTYKVGLTIRVAAGTASPLTVIRTCWLRCSIPNLRVFRPGFFQVESISPEFDAAGFQLGKNPVKPEIFLPCIKAINLVGQVDKPTVYKGQRTGVIRFSGKGRRKRTHRPDR